MKAVQMKLVGVTKKTVTVGWAWQRASKPIRVNRYRMMLRRGSEMQSRFAVLFRNLPKKLKITYLSYVFQ